MKSLAYLTKPSFQATVAVKAVVFQPSGFVKSQYAWAFVEKGTQSILPSREMVPAIISAVK